MGNILIPSELCLFHRINPSWPVTVLCRTLVENWLGCYLSCTKWRLVDGHAYTLSAGSSVLASLVSRRGRDFSCFSSISIRDKPGRSIFSFFRMFLYDFFLLFMILFKSNIALILIVSFVSFARTGSSRSYGQM